MDEQLVQKTLSALSNDWQKLKASLYHCDEINVKFFLEAFRKTEEFLRRCIGSVAIPKEYIPLIADVYAFVDAEAGDQNVQIHAAKILTERMLYQYVVNDHADEQSAGCVTVYLLKNRRQLTVDLTNVAMAFPIVAKALQA
ncbi:MAG: hypothetical protein IKT90_00960 [Clostridia bacterium]|nr:hypothetical protein [Clostridia bacterium]